VGGTAILDRAFHKESDLGHPTFITKNGPNPGVFSDTAADSLPLSVAAALRLDREAFSPVVMERKHPSTFQQLEKLGEGTYATVSMSETHSNILSGRDAKMCDRFSKGGIGKLESWSL